MAVPDIKTVFLVKTLFVRIEHNILISLTNPSKTKSMPSSRRETTLTLTRSFACWIKFNVSTRGFRLMLTGYGIWIRLQLTELLGCGTRSLHQESQRMVDIERRNPTTELASILLRSLLRPPSAYTSVLHCGRETVEFRMTCTGHTELLVHSAWHHRKVHKT